MRSAAKGPAEEERTHYAQQHILQNEFEAAIALNKYTILCIFANVRVLYACVIASVTVIINEIEHLIAFYRTGCARE